MTNQSPKAPPSLLRPLDGRQQLSHARKIIEKHSMQKNPPCKNTFLLCFPSQLAILVFYCWTCKHTSSIAAWNSSSLPLFECAFATIFSKSHQRSSQLEILERARRARKRQWRRRGAPGPRSPRAGSTSWTVRRGG